MIKKIFSDKIYASIALIFLFHIIGLIGFVNDPLVHLFKKLVPLHLLLMFGLVMWNNSSWNKQFIYFITSVYLLSFLTEMIGTNTGLLFGSYGYGATLGFKLVNTPILIGINWLILVYCVGCTLSGYKIQNKVFSAAIGASILVALDYFIEPVAMRFDYWQWQNNVVPIQNYIAWWVLSFIFMLIFNRLHFNKQNIVALILLIVQFLFFILLNLL